MRVAFKGRLDEAREAAKSGSLPERLTDGYSSAFGRKPGKEEVDTWRNTLPTVLDVAATAISKECGVLIEYALPFNDQRLDLVLLGGKNGAPAAHVLELKNWEQSRASSRLEHFVEAGGGVTLHPSYQVLNYAGKLANFHSFGPSLDVSQSAVIIDGEPRRHATLFDRRYSRLLSGAPLFISPEFDGLQALLRNRLPDPPKPEWLDKIVTGRYSQSARLLETLRERQSALIERASEVLATCGWGLSKDQLQVCDEVLSAMQQGERGVFCISGGPGSGKSLLAMHLFLGAIGLKRKSILAVRNNRLNETLREILNRELLGAQGMIKYFSTGTAGVEDDSSQVADVLVCDEGQRLALRSPNVFLRAPLVVVLHDDRQVLNEAERGTRDNLVKMCEQIGIAPQLRTLPTPHRCRGGYAYLRWVDVLLEEPDKLKSVSRDWLRDYEFSVAVSHQDLLARLRYRMEYRVGLLASFTRSSGKADPKNPRDLGKIRVPETDPPIRWLMQPKTDYVPFYLDGKSNRLDTCASIYGAQGFELDYAGVFWGTDLIFRDGDWAVGNPDDCYDRTPGARALSTLMRDEPTLALTLLRNRYRILLTRGIFGTTVFSEDAETNRFLQSIFAQ